MATKSQPALSSPGVVLISFKPPGWHLLGRRGQPEGSGAQVTKISKSVKDQSWSQVFLESDRWRKKQAGDRNVGLKQSTRGSDSTLHCDCTRGVLAQVMGIPLLFQVLYQHHPPQLCEHSGDGGGAFDRLLCWGFLSSCSRVPGGSRHLRRASHMRWR